MRYITEFEVAPYTRDNYEKIVAYEKNKHLPVLGQMIATIVGWKEVKLDRFALEIQAFSMEDWSNFKLELKNFIAANEKLGNSTYNLKIVANMLLKLEESGGDKIPPITKL